MHQVTEVPEEEEEEEFIIYNKIVKQSFSARLRIHHL